MAGRATLDGLLRRAAEIRPHATALRDAANRPQLIGGGARNFDWARLDETVDALAGRLRQLGFPTDSVIATQFPLGSDGIVAFLAIARAGMIVAPLPLGWGRRETVAHLQRLGARAILTAGRAGPVDCADMMRFAAAETFSVRFVMSIGTPVLDGVVPLDDVFDMAGPVERIETPRPANAADHVAVVTVDASAEGHLAVPRSHNEVIAGGLAAFMAGVPDETSIFAATLALDAFAGIALQLVPWLMCGGTLIAHPPFAPRVFADDLGAGRVSHAILPVAAAACLSDLGPKDRPALRHLTLLARRGADIVMAQAIRPEAIAVDTFFGPGEAGLTRTGGTPQAGGVPLGPDTFATGAGQAPVLVETRASTAGTLALRGAMVPAFAFPPGAERGLPPFWSTDAEGFFDTGLPVGIDKAARTLLVGDRPEGVVAIGGRRFAETEIREAYVEAGGEIAPVLRADPVLGQRVSGIVGDGRAIVGLAGRLAETGLTALGIPGGQRQAGPLPFEDTRPPEQQPARDPLTETQAALEQLLTMARAVTAR
ncbi:MAG: AMP-binding protein [Phreatobacter sp.]